jgi:hypothetical protein
MLASAYQGGGDSVPQCSGAVNLGDRLKGRPTAGLSALAVALLLAGCAGVGGPSGVITGEALQAPAAGGETAVAAQEIPAHEIPAVAETGASEAQATQAAPAASSQASSRAARDGARAAPPAQASGKPKELSYPSFGTAPQIGDRPVMSKEDTAKLQQELEAQAKEREAKARRELEEDQQ